MKNVPAERLTREADLSMRFRMMFREIEAHVLDLVLMGYTVSTIPDAQWLAIEEQIWREIAPSLRNSAFMTAAEVSLAHGLSSSKYLENLTGRDVETAGRQMAHRFTNRIRINAQKTVEHQQAADISLYFILSQYFNQLEEDEDLFESVGITGTTIAESRGRHSVATHLREIIGERGVRRLDVPSEYIHEQGEELIDADDIDDPDDIRYEVVEVWEIEDADACPVCQELDGETDELWGEEYPGGPPAHPNCRCRTRIMYRRI